MLCLNYETKIEFFVEYVQREKQNKMLSTKVPEFRKSHLHLPLSESTCSLFQV